MPTADVVRKDDLAQLNALGFTVEGRDTDTVTVSVGELSSTIAVGGKPFDMKGRFNDVRWVVDGDTDGSSYTSKRAAIEAAKRKLAPPIPRGRNGGRKPEGDETTERVTVRLQPSTIATIKGRFDMPLSAAIRQIVEGVIEKKNT